ncbi:MAG: methanogenesis marker 16 metalloprotein [Candidatus Methanogaster sp.]|uniref:Methanogenesis marker 16 metalloprotein n=1 Tax=Candidatus Methanogaster sp. TaxID=3386292 RepID=A0AC61L1K2_9EURY|nr:MAG: methanogenesis marker 16 metalloprotein [ANME-2 cluster archaeon]
MKTIAEINQKIKDGDVTVLTAKELCDAVRSGKSVSVEDVDVVTTATRGIMSGTLVILSFPVADPGVFSRAEQVFLNGVPANAGPCPNEHLGIIDLIVHGTAERNARYGGGHLFHDLISGAEIEVAVKAAGTGNETGTEKKSESGTGAEITTTVDIDDIPFARMLTTRSAYRNYNAFVNPGDAISTIFSVADFKGNCSEAAFGGCGEINPLEKDAGTIGVGTRILLNGAVGYVIGEGTRSTRERRNLSLFADMHEMDGSCISGFATSAGTDIINSIAMPIPVLSEDILSRASRLDSEIELPVVDIRTRKEIGRTDYSQVWRSGSEPRVTFELSLCVHCSTCNVLCPTGAFTGSEVINDLCCNCGHCASVCVGDAFAAEMGAIMLRGRKIPVTLRHSDRRGAIKLADELKQRIERGSFLLAEPVQRLGESI